MRQEERRRFLEGRDLLEDGESVVVAVNFFRTEFRRSGTVSIERGQPRASAAEISVR